MIATAFVLNKSKFQLNFHHLVLPSSYFVFIVLLLVESFFKELWLTNIGKQR